jgi:hypothetical protein
LCLRRERDLLLLELLLLHALTYPTVEIKHLASAAAEDFN